ncbi:hypothetical protein AMTR_s00070p00074560, partial [Amborella trichopoda]
MRKNVLWASYLLIFLENNGNMSEAHRVTAHSSYYTLSRHVVLPSWLGAGDSAEFQVDLP